MAVDTGRPAPGALSIFLIGMPASGKSTVGRHLARAAGLRFVDCDRELESRAGVSIPQIFEAEGEPAFRRRESQLLDELSRLPGLVLATGGGVVLDPANREHLRERGFAIYLEASVDEILRRTRSDTSRPLLRTSDPRVRIEALLAEREPLYRSIAHCTFHSGSNHPRRLAARMLADPQLARWRRGSEPDAVPNAD